MTLITKIILINIFFVPLCVIGQVKYLSNYPGFGLEIKDQSIFYEKYPDGLKIFGVCDSYEDCENIFPEQTLMSVLSADKYDWDQKNYNYDIENNAEKYKIINELGKSSVFFKPLNKVMFEWNNTKYSIIKYHIYEEDKITPTCSILIEKENKWFIIKPQGIMTKAFFMFNYLSQNSLDAIFNNKSIGVEPFDNQIKKIYSTGILNFKEALNSTSSSKMTKEELKLVLDPHINQ